MSLVHLYLTFFKIGLFGFGGGYAMISLIQQELIKYNWLAIEDFVDVIAIAEMTPGPIAINSGTFIGFKILLIPGALAATLGVISPSLILVIILALFFSKIKKSHYRDYLLKYLRPTVIGLIFSAAFIVAKEGINDFKGLAITLAVLFLLFKTKLHPLLIIFFSGLAGIIIYA